MPKHTALLQACGKKYKPMEIIIKHHLVPNGISRTVEPKHRPSLIEWLKEIHSRTNKNNSNGIGIQKAVC